MTAFRLTESVADLIGILTRVPRVTVREARWSKPWPATKQIISQCIAEGWVEKRERDGEVTLSLTSAGWDAWRWHQAGRKLTTRCA